MVVSRCFSQPSAMPWEISQSESVVWCLSYVAVCTLSPTHQRRPRRIPITDASLERVELEVSRNTFVSSPSCHLGAETDLCTACESLHIETNLVHFWSLHKEWTVHTRNGRSTKGKRNKRWQVRDGRRGKPTLLNQDNKR